MDLDTLFENHDLLMDSPNSTTKMRELILQLAVQGKLVPQDPTDEPASKLLKRIKAEKKKLIAEGKIRKQKPLPPIADDEIPYHLSQGWEWVRLEDVFCPISTSHKKIKSSEVREEGRYPVVDQGQKYVAGYTHDATKLIRIPGPVVIFGDHTCALKFIDFDFVAGADGVKILRPICLDEPYFFRALKTLKIEERGYSRHYKYFLNNIFPVPPMAEQKRIVAKVDQLMQLCDQLDVSQEKASKKYTSLNDAALEKLSSSKTVDEFAGHWQFLCNNFDLIYNDPAHVNKLRQAILQLAVQGKLTPQDLTDEPAGELLKHIKAEKEKLIAEGKIKKQKPLPPITENETPYELPQGWEWVRFGAVFDVTSSKRIHVSDYVSEGVPFFRSKEIGELKNGKPITTDIFISNEKFEELRDLPGFPNVGDLMLTSVGSIGNSWICDGRNFYYKDGNITKIGSHQYTDIRYVQDFIDAPLFDFQVTNTVSGTAYNALTIVKLNNLIFPLPPLAEQHRIVAKVDQLMQLCDELETRLNQSKKDSEMLMQAVLQEAFGS